MCIALSITIKNIFMFMISFAAVGILLLIIYRQITYSNNPIIRFRKNGHYWTKEIIQACPDADLLAIYLLVKNAPNNHALTDELIERQLLYDKDNKGGIIIIDKGSDQYYSLLYLTDNAILQISRMTPKPAVLIRISKITHFEVVYGGSYQSVGYITLANIMMKRKAIKLDYADESNNIDTIYVLPNFMNKWLTHLERKTKQDR